MKTPTDLFIPVNVDLAVVSLEGKKDDTQPYVPPKYSHVKCLSCAQENRKFAFYAKI